MKLISYIAIAIASVTQISSADIITLTMRNIYMRVDMEKSNILRPIPDTISNDCLDSLVLAKAIDYAKKKGGNIQFTTKPSVVSRFSFEAVPGLTMYSLQLYSNDILDLGDPYTAILINQRDSSFYHFEGDITDFYEVMLPYFEADLDLRKIEALLEFYLNTSSAGFPYYVLWTSGDLDSIMKNWRALHYDDDRQRGFIKEILRRAELAKKQILPFSCEEEDGRYSVKLYTFDTRDIEYWEFMISLHEFKLIKREKAFTIYDPSDPNLYIDR